ncbi:MAG: hypothetical protein KAJ19_20750 [Gammaproteobacteria bacterium]|nr:hypothetical protein [Gammaproteobacteria bacterium]
MKKPNKVTISNSFTEGQVKLLQFITDTLLRGGDPRMASRHKEMPKLAAKVTRMRLAMREKKKKQQQRQGGEHAKGTGEKSCETGGEGDSS